MTTLVAQTRRLALRHLTLEDAAFIVALLNEPSFVRYIGDKRVRTEDDAREYLLAGPLASYRSFGFGLFAVVSRETGQPIGMCGLLKREVLEDVDIGFAFLPAYWSKGYASEASAAVMAYAESRLALARLVAITAPDNTASIALLEKLGFRFERMARLSPEAPELKLFAVALAGSAVGQAG